MIFITVSEYLQTLQLLLLAIVKDATYLYQLSPAYLGQITLDVVRIISSLSRAISFRN